MEDKSAEISGNKLLSDIQPSLEDKSVGKISASTTTTSLYTEDEQDTPEVTPERTILAKPKNMSPGAVKLRSWLNQLLRITMTDGRVLIGMFFCTDRDANIILGACSEYLPEEVDADGVATKEVEEPRILGLVMVPGKHIVNISVDQSEDAPKNWSSMNQPLNPAVVTQDDVM
ncbi:small nuclear ribonucleoprotein-associated protein b and n [Holotrichia oblita]|uniref:Small nuclear ribonucleoprotein-associated protein b and n n=1 Tax=Holotrichia oblita TaxID=644536 RepID=A0ACB9T8J5_HOLOL|nr:small nuclear ribonucleoprotein-associated protein b and n [Holotrichia oblita]